MIPTICKLAPNVVDFRAYCELKWHETKDEKYATPLMSRCLRCHEVIQYSILEGETCSPGCKTTAPVL